MDNHPNAMALLRRPPLHVLLVLDQPGLVAGLRRALAALPPASQVRVVSDAATAGDQLATWRPHLAVVDLELVPSECLTRWGTTTPWQGERVPVIALTRRGGLPATLAAFDRGVEDVLTVPFAPEELVARMLAVLQRTSRTAPKAQPVLQFGELEVDLLNRRVRAGLTEIQLTSLEQSLLYLLAANAGRVLTRDEIMDHLWGVDFVAESNVVDRHVRNLRAKLRDSWRAPRYIATIPGQGYRFVPASEAERWPPARLSA